jgi:hypothetical protein
MFIPILPLPLLKQEIARPNRAINFESLVLGNHFCIVTPAEIMQDRCNCLENVNNCWDITNGKGNGTDMDFTITKREIRICVCDYFTE